MYSEIPFECVVLKLYLSSVSFKYALEIVVLQSLSSSRHVLILATTLAVQLSDLALCFMNIGR